MNKHKLNILAWPEQQQEICACIGSEKATLKIVTKTKNEGFFLEKWIQHHKKIVDGTRLIIFDNLSTDTDVFEIYKKYENDIFVFSFMSHVDSIHTTMDGFMPLYTILEKSCNFFTIIDSDEFLYLYDGFKLCSDNKIIKLLNGNTNINLFIPAWVDTIDFSENTFMFNHKNLYMFNGSKPIINAHIVHAFGHYNILHHAHKLPVTVYGYAPTCFVLLHMRKLNKTQRIKANMEKLVSNGIIRHNKDYYTVLNCDVETVHPSGNIRGYILEIRRLIDAHDSQADLNTGKISMENGLVEIGDDKSLNFFPPELKAEFTRLVNMKTDYFDLIGFDPKIFILDNRINIEEYLRKQHGSKSWQYPCNLPVK